MLAPVDLSKKYSHFMTPKNQILLDHENLQQKYGITAATIIAELPTGEASKFAFTFDDPQVKWVNSSMFESNKPVEIKMGYGDTFETVASGDICLVKTVFSSSGAPRIEVSGEGKPFEPLVPAPVFGLEFGVELNNFIATMENQGSKKAASTSLASSFVGNVSCIAECLGLPDIKPGVMLTLTGLSSKFNRNYLVEKVVHSWDNVYGFRTSFDGKALPRIVKVFRPNI